MNTIDIDVPCWPFQQPAARKRVDERCCHHTILYYWQAVLAGDTAAPHSVDMTRASNRIFARYFHIPGTAVLTEENKMVHFNEDVVCYYALLTLFATSDLTNLLSSPCHHRRDHHRTKQPTREYCTRGNVAVAMKR